MNFQSDPQSIVAALELDPHRAAKALGELLRETPEFQNYIQALRTVNGDIEILKLAARIRGHRTALQWKTGDTTPHTTELERLEQELETHPVYQAFRQVQNEVRVLFHTVDLLISQTAGVEFSANAKRSRGCCG